MMLVTLKQAKDHLLRDTDAGDDDLKLKIEAASAAVLDYLGDYTATFLEDGKVKTDGAGNPVNVPARVQQAVLLTVGYFFIERDGSQEFRVDSQYGYGYALPQSAVALLYSLRKPTVV